MVFGDGNWDGEGNDKDSSKEVLSHCRCGGFTSDCVGKDGFTNLGTIVWFRDGAMVSIEVWIGSDGGGGKVAPGLASCIACAAAFSLPFGFT